MIKIGKEPAYWARLDEYGLAVGDVSWSEVKSRPSNWSNDLQRSGDLVDPDVSVTTCDRALREDLSFEDVADPREVRLGPELGSATAYFCETANILSQISPRPVVVGIPGPYSLLRDRFGGAWTELFREETASALDPLYECSQYLSDVIRQLGDSGCAGLLLDDRQLMRTSPDDLEDLLLEYGALFNLSDHLNLPLAGIVPDDVLQQHPAIWEPFDALIGESTPHPPEGADGTGSTGRLVSPSLWTVTEEPEFTQQVEGFLDDCTGEGCDILYADVPRGAIPERVQQFRRVLSSVRSEG